MLSKIKLTFQATRAKIECPFHVITRNPSAHNGRDQLLCRQHKYL